MSEVKISQLPSATTPLTGSEIIPLVQSGVTKKTPISSLTTYTVNTVADLRSVVPGTYDIVNVKGYFSVGDGGGGQFRSVTTGGPYGDNGGTIITQSGGAASTAWFRVYNGPINLLWFGVVRGYLSSTSPEATANLYAIQNALKFIAFSTSPAKAPNTLFIPAGDYYINNNIGLISGTTTSIASNTTICGEGSGATTIVYNNTSASTNNMLVISKVNDVTIENLGITYSPGATGQASTCFYVDGDSNDPVTNLTFTNVKIVGFRQSGITFNSGIYYAYVNGCKIYNVSNGISPSPLSAFNGAGITFGVVASVLNSINAIRMSDTRIQGCDIAIADGGGPKNSMSISGCTFESNGHVYTPPAGKTSPIQFNGWRSLDFNGCYLEINETGSATSDGMILLNDCSGVAITANNIVGSYGGVSGAKNLISCTGTTENVTVKNCRLEDPQTYFCYSSGTGSAIQFQRNTYVYGGAQRKTYTEIMGSYMSAAYVEVDIPKVLAVSFGSVNAGASAYNDYTIEGLILANNPVLTVTPNGFGSEFLISATVISTNTVRVLVYNTDASPKTFNGNLLVRVTKSGSY